MDHQELHHDDHHELHHDDHEHHHELHHDDHHELHHDDHHELHDDDQGHSGQIGNAPNLAGKKSKSMLQMFSMHI